MMVITGVSRGLGAALFDQLHEAGYPILALGRTFTDEQRAAEGDQVRLRVTDLSRPEDLPGAAELAQLVGGHEVTLIHNAATIEPFAPIGAIHPEWLIYAANVNMIAPMLLTNALLAAVAVCLTVSRPVTRLVHVVYVSSSAAHCPSGGRSIYCSTKRGAEMFMECLGQQHADDPSVTATVVDPGIMDTDMQAAIRAHALSGTYFPDRERFLARYQRGDVPSPQSVARRIIAEHIAPTSPLPIALDAPVEAPPRASAVAQ
jgi:NAD(P)-dependent dehydrogenase (short-subunit alcohol dehydrogenase family)